MTEYKIWCEDCADWVDDLECTEGDNPEWLYCSGCGLGLIMVKK